MIKIAIKASVINAEICGHKQMVFQEMLNVFCQMIATTQQLLTIKMLRKHVGQQKASPEAAMIMQVAYNLMEILLDALLLTNKMILVKRHTM